MKFCPTFLLILMCLAGCASHPRITYNPEKIPSFLEKTIKGKYEYVFNAAQISLSGYPIAVSDMEAGILKTDIIKGEQMWHPPHLDKREFFGHRYTISIQLLKIKDKEAVQVTIIKDIEHKKNFFAEYQKVKTDGLEEIALLYRIQRELIFQKISNTQPENPPQ